MELTREERRIRQGRQWVRMHTSIVRQNRDYSIEPIDGFRMPDYAYEFSEWLKKQHEGKPIEEWIYKKRIESGQAICLW